MSLNNTPLHNKIKRAFPQTDWPQSAIDLLSLYDEGEDILAYTLKYDEREMLNDLATAGLIEMHRYPKYSSGMFAGFVISYRYRKNLDYGPNTNSIDTFEKKRKETLLIGIAVGFAVTIAVLCILNWILK